MTVGQHAKATVALVAIALNLLVWCVPLLLLFPLKLLVPPMRPWFARRAADVYRAAVTVDDWWLGAVAGASWQQPALDLNADETCVVISNHVSWADIFVLQSVVSRRGPILKFLCKRELAWIPVLGLIFLAFDFPMLARARSSARELPARTQRSRAPRRGDIERIREACAGLADAPAAMLAFVEGTRFREAKRDPGAALERLLPPRVGGFAAILAALEPLRVTVVDVALVYPEPRPAPLFWRFLAGDAGPVDVVVQATPAGVIAKEGAKPWLERRWVEKDALLRSAATAAEQPR
ncbi:MAG: hypothetical protein F4Y86_10570 [Gammaproteobacteria bacterium]|nr:hypothetical protein [Gammaproteobacteria bacterium]MYB39516.1 hypothetical protein [Gammaproteobacteria bacterium]